MIAPNVEIDAGGASCHADDSQHGSLLRAQDSGALQAVAGGVGRPNDGHQIAELVLHNFERLLDSFNLRPLPIPAHTADGDHSAQHAASGQGFAKAQHHLPHTAGMGIGNHESHVVGDGAGIGDVIRNSFQFKQNGAQKLCPRRDLDFRCPLDGLAECSCVREGRIARNAFGQKDRAGDGETLEELLGSLVRVKHTELQVQDRFAGDGEVEVAGLDDAGMNRADRNVKDALAVRWPVDVPLALERGQHGVEREILAQRMHVGPVIVQRHAPRIRMPGGFQAEPVLNLALRPVDARQLRGQRRK